MAKKAGWPIACEVVDPIQEDTRVERDDWRTEIASAHPRLFQPAKALPDCREGWRHLINDACTKIESALNWNAGDTITLVKIMQRAGLLHILWEGVLSAYARARVETILEWTYIKSASTCEFCGRHGHLYSCGGWLVTACKIHAKGQLAPQKHRVESIRLVRAMVNGQVRILSCRQYDRVHDCFVDAYTDSLGIVRKRSEKSHRLDQPSH